MLVISTNTPQWQLLRECVNKHTTVVVLDYHRYTLEKLLTTMQDFSEVPRPLQISCHPFIGGGGSLGSSSPLDSLITQSPAASACCEAWTWM